MPPTGNLTGIGKVFDVTAVYSATGQPAQLVAGQVATITVIYQDADVGAALEGTLALHHWNGAEWAPLPGSSVDTDANTVTASTTHFSQFAVLGETHRLFAPLAVRGN
jgi:hypothetical protein